jgi:hypothetical protein
MAQKWEMKLGNDIKKKSSETMLLSLLGHENNLRSPLLTDSGLAQLSILAGIYELLACSEI